MLVSRSLLRVAVQEPVYHFFRLSGTQLRNDDGEIHRNQLTDHKLELLRRQRRTT